MICTKATSELREHPCNAPRTPEANTKNVAKLDAI